MRRFNIISLVIGDVNVPLQGACFGSVSRILGPGQGVVVTGQDQVFVVGPGECTHLL